MKTKIHIQYQNPFHKTPDATLSKDDAKRLPLRMKHKIMVMFRPMHVQFTDGYIFHYKRADDGSVYLFKAESVKHRRKTDGEKQKILD